MRLWLFPRQEKFEVQNVPAEREVRVLKVRSRDKEEKIKDYGLDENVLYPPKKNYFYKVLTLNLRRKKVKARAKKIQRERK